MSDLNKLDETPKPLNLKDKISNENLALCIYGKSFVLHEEKYFCFAAAKLTQVFL